MSSDAQVIVVGLGAVGSAALLSLASRGVRCIGVDRFDPPHTRGSSHGLSRLIRLCYYEHPDYVPLLIESYRLWRDLETRSCTRLLDITGGVYIGRPHDPFVAGSLQTAIERGLEHELLSPAKLRQQIPVINVSESEVAFFEPTTGVLFPERCITSSLRIAEASGAQIRRHTKVLEWSDTSSRVRVLTESGVLCADVMILCAGAWTSHLMPELSPRLSITRQVLAWFEPKNPELLMSGHLPAWAVSREDGAAFYGFPIVASDGPDRLGGVGFKVALHATGPAADPEQHRTEVETCEIEQLREFLLNRFPAAFGGSPKLLNACACMYTNTPDHHFLIDRHPRSNNVIVVSACSGHGFKLSPAIGRAAADLAFDGHTSLPIEFLSWRPSMRST